MKLRNKKTGEIVDFSKGNFISSKDYGFVIYKDGGRGIEYNSLTELNEEWEDYEEPKLYYYITSCGEVSHRGYGLWGNISVYDKKRIEIGNHFETEEETEKAVEKLKAITRLNKCGFKFEGYTDRDRADGGSIVIYASINIPHNNLLEEAQPAMLKDLDLLFGGEK